MSRFLLVDPESSERADYRRHFDKEFDIDEAHDARSAWVLIESRRYQRGLMRVELPDGSGLDLLEALRRNGQRCPVLMVARAYDSTQAGRALALGSVLVVHPVARVTLGVLAKPHKSRSPAGLAREYARRHELTPRQTELLQAVARGTRPSALPEVLGVARGTVKALTRQILEKTDASCLDDLLSDILRAADAASESASET